MIITFALSIINIHAEHSRGDMALVSFDLLPTRFGSHDPAGPRPPRTPGACSCPALWFHVGTAVPVLQSGTAPRC